MSSDLPHTSIHIVSRARERFQQQYGMYLKDKTVVFVGYDKYTELLYQAQFIESFDIVARMSRSLPITEEKIPYIGQHTDLVVQAYFQALLKPEDIPSSTAFIVCVHPDKKFGHKVRTRYQNKIPFFQISSKIYDDLCQLFKGSDTSENTVSPHEHVAAIWHLLRHPIKSLYITGCVFSPIEQQILRQMWINNTRLTFDPVLQRVLLGASSDA